MDIKEVKIELGKDWSGYQDVLVSALNNKNAFVSKINRYLIDNAGKQLRPVLSLLAARACGQANELNYYCAAVAEMIHTATPSAINCGLTTSMQVSTVRFWH